MLTLTHIWSALQHPRQTAQTMVIGLVAVTSMITLGGASAAPRPASTAQRVLSVNVSVPVSTTAANAANHVISPLADECSAGAGPCIRGKL